MRGKSLLITVLVLFAAGAGYFYLQDSKKNEALKPVLADAAAECRANIEFLNKCASLARDSGSEEAAMSRAMGDTKFQLKAKAINDLLRVGIEGEKKKAMTVISDKIDNYNAMLAYAFYTGAGAGNVSVSQPSNPPSTQEMIKEFGELAALLGKQ